MLKSPCKNCNSRYLGCHSECKDYLEFYNKNEDIKLKRQEELLIEGYIKCEIYKNWKSRLGTSRKINLREH